MNIEYYENDVVKYALSKDFELFINTTQDALDLMADCSYNDFDTIILFEENFTPDFFDLKTGIAGEILQKFSNYGMRLGIIGEYSKYQSKSLRDFIYECNKSGKILFMKSIEEILGRFKS